MSICRGLLTMAAIFYCLAIAPYAQQIHGYSSQQKEAMLSHSVSNRQGHPNLYFSAEGVPRLRNLVNGSHAGLYKKLVQIVRAIGAADTPPDNWKIFSAKWNEVYGNNLAVLATYCVLTPSDRQALSVAKLYMERLARLPSWRVRGKEMDDVPVAHTLLGFVTAFDFLHASFTRVERSRYRAKAREACGELYMSSFTKWWGRSFIHNHVATNYLALLAAALILRRDYPNEALRWQQRSIIALNNTLTLLRLVVDGSLQEGVSYGSYTMRSLTQFVYLSERHFHYSYRHNNWLRDHFDFMLHSTLPGYQKTVGIADSIQHWAYGPESQLTFLENYVRRDGRAIWLANQIRTLRPASKMKNLLSNIHSTVHTEFLFYNSSLNETSTDEAKLHVFTDWGVITYGGGTPAGNVFLSFKCGRLHGRAMNMLYSNLTKNKRARFNAGHEQPDHGSFVFIAKEQPVITESFYAPKFSFLENVLLFGHSKKPSCSSPYQGQLGECDMWFNYHDEGTWEARGELVGYSRHGDVIFMSGDMTGWYNQSLGLQSVGRALIMLTPSTLVVVDTIRLATGSPTTHVSAFFHNVDLPFEKKSERSHGGRFCAMVGRYSMCWAHHNSQTVNVTTRENFKVDRARYATNFINVTSRCAEGSLSSTAYIFYGPDDVLHDVAVFRTSPEGDGVMINVKINSNEYDITISARHENPRLRRNLLGSSGYGTLRVNKSTPIDLGLKGALPCDMSKNDTRTSAITRDQPFGEPSAVFALTSLVALVCLLLHMKRRLGSHFYIRWTMFGFFIFWLATFFRCFSTKSIILALPGSLPSGRSPTTAKDTASQWQSARPKSRPVTRSPHQLDAVIAMGLPLNGAEIARELFTTNTDFAVVAVPSRNVVTPSGVSLLKENLDLCEWREHDSSYVTLTTGINMTEFAEWWEKILATPWKVRRNKNKEHISLSNPLDPDRKYGTEVIKSEGALAFVHFRNPGWLFRVSWLNARFLGYNFIPVLYVMRDPRSWIEHMLNNSESKTLLEQLHRALTKDDHCKFSSEILGFRKVYDVVTKPHVVFAHIWVAFASYASKLIATLPSGRFRIVRFEDLISSPKETSEDMYGFLRMPFPAAVEHRILQVTKSGVFQLENYGVIDRQHKTWGKILSSEQVLEVERICGEMMSIFGYS